MEHTMVITRIMLTQTRRGSHVVEPDLAGAHHQVAVEEDGLDDDVPRQDVGGHHLGLGRGLDQALPGVGGVGDHKPELEVPLL